ncbi:MAG TPA: uroporphyrinogen-III synthase [Sphingomicrobium sp.]|nr:uroporphyrinogen-III synthase [Sphingomicrobium sp.]
MRRLFVFRPEPAAHRTVERARELGLEATAIPLFELEALDWPEPDPTQFDGILLTSANAVNMGGPQLEHLRGLPVHAVGEATALAAEVAGFGIASIGQGGVEDLLESVEADARLIHLCGEDRRAPDRPKQQISCVTVYRARTVDAPGGIERLRGQVAAVHSPRAGKRLVELVPPEDRREITIAAISKAAAEAAGTGWADVRVATVPTDSALLVLARSLCET